MSENTGELKIPATADPTAVPASGSVVQEHFRRGDPEYTETAVSTEAPRIQDHSEGDYPTTMLQKIRDSVIEAFLKTRQTEYADFQKGLQRKSRAFQQFNYFTGTVASQNQIIAAVERRIESAKLVSPGVTMAKAGLDIFNVNKFNETLFVLGREMLLAQIGDEILKVMRDELSVIEQEFERFKKEYRNELRQQKLI